MEALGDYKLLKKIGEGTLGEVFLAEHQFLKKQFILKVFPESLASDTGFVERFKEQVAQLSALDHPHIVKVHNVSFSDGKYFLVLDSVLDPFGEVSTLSRYLAKSKPHLNENEVFDILSQVASALTYAHSIPFLGGVLAHRSLKLSNILVGKGERGIHVFLSDFGLAQIVGEGAILTRMYQVLAQGAQVNVSALVQGVGELPKLPLLHASFQQTYAFLAPEQKVYRENQAGISADTYAFGVLAYFLLMRSYPEGAFEVPSSVYPDYRMHWDQLILSCMSADPAKRPASIQLALDALKPTQTPHYESAPSEVVDTPDTGSSTGGGGTATLTEEKVEVKETVTVRQDHAMLSQVSQMVQQKAKPVLNPQEVEKPNYDIDPAAAFQIEKTVHKFTPEVLDAGHITPILTEMCKVKGGTFYRGSDSGARDEKPRHQITLKDFAIDKHPVTNEQFVRFLEMMGGEKDCNNHDIIRLKDCRIKKHGGRYSVEAGYNKHPVVGVTWYGASAYAKWVGKRLPTEAEFEVAAAGGMPSTTYSTGQEIERTQANFFNSDTTAVMSYPPNGSGLFDMAGNVYEWCEDWYEYDYYDHSEQEPNEPKGPSQGVYRVLRGGCWKSLKEDLRIAHRHRNNPGTVNTTYGFRLAAELEVL